MKNSKVLYTEWAGIFEDLTPEDAKRLIIAILKCTPEETIDNYFPIGDSLRPVFRPIKSNLDSNAKKYEETVKKRMEAGKKGGEAKAAKMRSKIDTSTGEVFEPIDEPMTSELTVDTILDDDLSQNDCQTCQTLSEFIESHVEGVMKNEDWNHFSEEYPDAEKIRMFSNIGVVTAMTLYGHIRNNFIK